MSPEHVHRRLKANLEYPFPAALTPAATYTPPPRNWRAKAGAALRALIRQRPWVGRALLLGGRTLLVPVRVARGVQAQALRLEQAVTSLARFLNQPR